MSLLQPVDLRVVKTGPGWHERLERGLGVAQHSLMLARLQHFREGLEREMDEPWTTLEAPMVVLLSDVCDALDLTEEERAGVLGREGTEALTNVLETKIKATFDPRAVVNTRQAKGLAHLRKNERLDLATYRELCPGFSDETLRLDLASLVRRGILTKSGANKGTYYAMA